MTPEPEETPDPEPKPDPEPAPQAQAEPSPEVHTEPAPVEPEWATDADIPEPWVDRVLPVLGKKVRIRRIGALEGAELAYIPEFARFGELMSELILESRGPKEDEDPDDPARIEKRKDLEVERTRYGVMMTHVAVMDPRADPEPVKCDDCSLVHPPSLWTKARCEQVHHQDLAYVTRVADREDEIELKLPFSEAGAPPDTPPSANTGESTPA
jgi:hypothetical protein